MSDLAIEPLVSVIIPTYNRANTIKTALESVIRQTYSNIEIIVIDDGSTDNTEQVVGSFSDVRIKYFHTKLNQGGASARNKGISLAKGDFVALLDSDDVWLSDKLKKQIDLLKKSGKEKKTVCYCQVWYSKSGIPTNFDRLTSYPKYPARGKYFNEPIGDYLLSQHGAMSSSTLVLSHDLAIQTLFDEQFRKHQDWDFLMRLEARGASFEFIEEPLLIWNLDDSFVHVGKQVNVDLSIQWLRHYADSLSQEAYKNFILKVAVPNIIKKNVSEMFKVTRLIIYGWIKKELSIKVIIKTLIKTWRK